MACAGLRAGDCVLDVACGTGVTALDAAARVSPDGKVVGVDLSSRMVDAARQRALQAQCANVRFERMGAEGLELPDHSFDVVLCALGLMYVPNPEHASWKCVGCCASPAVSSWRSGRARQMRMGGVVSDRRCRSHE